MGKVVEINTNAKLDEMINKNEDPDDRKLRIQMKIMKES